MFGAFDISASALTAQRTRFETIQSNIANMDNIVGPDGKNTPYRRLQAIFEAQRTPDGLPGVRVREIAEDPRPFQVRKEPWNPYHDAEGNVKYPNVDLFEENVNALESSRAYEANVTAIETTKSMMNATLRLIG
ncbi:MAG TPA: flagellar basal body rod protein FlgC [Phycisphaerae bacterium]|jgi:flagellar basal-body rod protein FlgC|nr:flagellar basal body rod protein FlgC [Phycisphaerae bacterium]